jgi:uncharacterized protein
VQHKKRKMRVKLIVLFLILIGFQLKSQNIDRIAFQICDSIKTIPKKSEDTLKIIKEQIEIQNAIILKTNILAELAKGNVKNNINVFNYKLTRELNKNCPDYKIENSVLLGNTGILDIESLFSKSELDSINNLVIRLRKRKSIGLLIITVDDLYPYNNISEYAENKGNSWHIGSRQEKGGLLLVFSKSLRKVRISTSNISQNYLTDEESQRIIDKVLLPEFKQGKYFDAVVKFITELEK